LIFTFIPSHVEGYLFVSPKPQSLILRLAFVATFGLELGSFCAYGKTWAKNAVKKIVSVEEKSRILFALGSIMYS